MNQALTSSPAALCAAGGKCCAVAVAARLLTSIVWTDARLKGEAPVIVRSRPFTTETRVRFPQRASEISD
jgi:hypothetical protein